MCYKADRLVALLPTFPSVCCLQYDVCAGLAEAVRPIWFWPDHFFTQAKKKKFLVGFDQCGFMAWQRKSSKYSDNTATVTPVLLQRASDNRSSVVSSTGLGVLQCGTGMRSRLGRGSAHAHNTCSVTTCTPKSTRYTKYSPPILLYYVYYSISIYMYTAYAHFTCTVHML